MPNPLSIPFYMCKLYSLETSRPKALDLSQSMQTRTRLRARYFVSDLFQNNRKTQRTTYC